MLVQIFPNDQINFIYEDRTDHEKYPIAGDAILIEKNMPNDYTICVDGMLATADFYKKILKENISIREVLYMAPRGFQ